MIQVCSPEFQNQKINSSEINSKDPPIKYSSYRCLNSQIKFVCHNYESNKQFLIKNYKNTKKIHQANTLTHTDTQFDTKINLNSLQPTLIWSPRSSILVPRPPKKREFSFTKVQNSHPTFSQQPNTTPDQPFPTPQNPRST